MPNSPIISQKLPEHIAIIMDGNGRWAQERGLDRSEGHFEGLNNLHRIALKATKMGIKYLTMYGFSTENWNRPENEVDALLRLMVFAVGRETKFMLEENMRFNVIGNFGRLPKEVQDSLNQSIEATRHCTGLTLNMALSYSSRWEIADAARRIAADVSEGRLSLDDINEDAVSQRLTTAGCPDPDILIRTGGDFRVSNFLLWQIAYSEIFVTPTFWPAFTDDDFVSIIEAYQNRERRFGLTSEQIADNNKPHSSDNE